METDNTAGTDSRNVDTQYPAMWSPLRYFYCLCMVYNFLLVFIHFLVSSARVYLIMF